jgi:hypothetical protein
MINWVYGELLDSICGSKSSKLTPSSLQARVNLVFTNCPLNQTPFDILVTPCKIFFSMRSQRVHKNTERRNILNKVIEIPFQIHSITSLYAMYTLNSFYLMPHGVFFLCLAYR